MSTGENKKNVILQLLSGELKPISLSEILKKLGYTYPERSVRRWLAEMAKEGTVIKLGEKRSSKYKIATPFINTHEPRVRINPFGIKSQEIITQVERPLYERTPVTYNREWLEAYQPNITFYIPAELRKELFEAGKRSQKKEPAGTYAHQIFNRLLIDLSYNSSRLEGNTYSLLDTKKLLMSGKSAEGKLDEEKIMILNHKEAIRFLVNNAPKLVVDSETIFTLHYLLSDGLIETHYSGKIRDHAIRISGSTYIPVEDIQQIKAQLKEIIQKSSKINDPYEKSLFLLIHLSYLQSFTDVNKRTARLSANIPLIKNNLVPLSFNDVNREDYISSIIAIYELQKIEPLLELYSFSYLRTCALYDETIKNIGLDEIRVRFRAERRALIQEIILHKHIGDSLEQFISENSNKIPKNEKKDFIEDVMEDLNEIDQSRIVGLGVTKEQLKLWLKKRDKSS